MSFVKNPADAALVGQLLDAGFAPPEVTYVGTLIAVKVGGEVRSVARRALGVVPQLGLVTGSSRRTLLVGLIDRPPQGGERHVLEALYYFRPRPKFGASVWIHDTPGAQVVLSPRGAVRRAFIEAPREHRCRHLPGDFICSLP